MSEGPVQEPDAPAQQGKQTQQSFGGRASSEPGVGLRSWLAGLVGRTLCFRLVSDGAGTERHRLARSSPFRPVLLSGCQRHVAFPSRGFFLDGRGRVFVTPESPCRRLGAKYVLCEPWDALGVVHFTGLNALGMWLAVLCFGLIPRAPVSFSSANGYPGLWLAHATALLSSQNGISLSPKLDLAPELNSP